MERRHDRGWSQQNVNKYFVLFNINKDEIFDVQFDRMNANSYHSIHNAGRSSVFPPPKIGGSFFAASERFF